jgi:hypothetical protein
MLYFPRPRGLMCVLRSSFLHLGNGRELFFPVAMDIFDDGIYINRCAYFNLRVQVTHIICTQSPFFHSMCLFFFQQVVQVQTAQCTSGGREEVDGIKAKPCLSSSCN